MNYRVIAPLGNRDGLGTFDTVFPEGITKGEAIEQQRAVVINFVQDEHNIIYFEMFHLKRPQVKLYRRLSIQHFPFGIDVLDDAIAMQDANEILTQMEKENVNSDDKKS